MMEQKDVERFVQNAGYEPEDVEQVIIRHGLVQIVLFIKDKDGKSIIDGRTFEPVTYMVQVNWEGKKVDIWQ